MRLFRRLLLSSNVTYCSTRPHLHNIVGFSSIDHSSNTAFVRFSKRQFTSSQQMKSESSSESHSSCHLSSRAVLRLSGLDTPVFLQGLVTNDVNQLMEKSPDVQYCMMLNVQGRVLYDMFLYNITKQPSAPTLLVDVDKSVKEEFVKLLRKYKLRKKVDISDVSSEFTVSAKWGQNGSKHTQKQPEQLIFHDPRVPLFANRLISSGVSETTNTEGETAYRLQRYRWGIPEGVLDLPPGNCLPLESNLGLMNGVSFQKGCYIGQELTARTFHTGVTRKRLMPVVLEREVEIKEGETISTDKGRNAGKFRSSLGNCGLGLLRLAHVNDTLSVIGQDGQQVTLKPQEPSWWPPTILNPTS